MQIREIRACRVCGNPRLVQILDLGVQALTGRFERDERSADLDAVMREIDDARLEEAARLLRAQEGA